MPVISVNLFGKFSVYSSEHRLSGLDACKVQELFAYLLIYRNRPHPRETLASLLWGDCLTALSKKYLRQALWQLQAALGSQIESLDKQALIVEAD
jgi:DNA-binding SARP family transcriptional activator